MTNLKKLLLLFLLICGSTKLLAQTALVVHQKSGEVVYYSFSEQPKVKYEGADLVLTTSKTEVKYPLRNLSRFTFGDMASGIDDMPVTKADVKVNNGTIAVTGAKPSSTISIFNINGTLVTNLQANEEGDMQYNTSALPTGVYVVKSENVTFKFIKK